MKQFLIVAILIICAFLIYILLTRQILEKFIDNTANKVLIDETDIPELASEPSIHDSLLEKDPKFLEEQLELYDKTRAIINKIIATIANISNGETKDEKMEQAIQGIAKETYGESPRFCSASRVKELLKTPVVDGLSPLFKCIPSEPSKYLILLSYASKKLKGQLDGVQGVLGLQNLSASADDLPPPSEVELQGRRAGSAAALAAEGFTASASASAVLANTSGVENVYISAYAIPNTASNSNSGEASVSASATASGNSIENELAAWKAAYNTESLTRIKQYLKYCTAALKDIDDINNAGKDGSLIKKINMDKVVASVKTQLEQRASSSSSFNLPF